MNAQPKDKFFFCDRVLLFTIRYDMMTMQISINAAGKLPLTSNFTFKKQQSIYSVLKDNNERE